jgi:Gluconate 2-dehydrogenase subunit 3
MTLRNRYPDADVLAQRGHWDDATRRVVMDRVHNVPEFRFFDAHQRATLEALCAYVVPQSHRPPQRQVPLAPWIDARCAGGHTDGFRLDDMPPNAEAWRLGLEGLDQTAAALERLGDVRAEPAPKEEETTSRSHGNGGSHGNVVPSVFFKDLGSERQREVLERVRRGDPPGEVWQRMPAKKWWIFVALRQITAVYYAHPFAWDEIGFGGPAYPRGYFALNFGYPEPWEARER